MVQRLAATWSDIERCDVFAGSLLGRLATLARTGTHLHGNDALRATLTEALPIPLIEDLPVRFECVAASIEGAAEHWFTRRPAGRRRARVRRRAGHPAAGRGRRRALHRRRHRQLHPGRPRRRSSAPTRIFVMHVGRLDRPLEPPRWPWEVALVAFEIARRHRFLGDLASLPDDVEVHVLPTGQPEPPKYNDLSALRYRVSEDVGESIDRAHTASLPTWTSAACEARSAAGGPAASDRAARARRRAAADRRLAVAGRGLGAAVAAVRRAPADPGAGARRWPGRAGTSPSVAACALLWAGRGGGTARTTRSCAGSSARIARTALRVARVKVAVATPRRPRRCSPARERPVVVLSIHSGEGDSLLVLDQLLRRHGRRPRIVMHQALALDPLIDMLGSRLPNRFVDPRGGDIEVEIAAMSRDLGADDAVLIFPEGGNFTAERRLRSIERLLHRGHHEQAEQARGDAAPLRAAPRRRARRAGERAGRRRRLHGPLRLPGRLRRGVARAAAADADRGPALARARRRRSRRARTRGSTGCSAGGRRSTRGSPSAAR